LFEIEARALRVSRAGTEGDGPGARGALWGSNVGPSPS